MSGGRTPPAVHAALFAVQALFAGLAIVGRVVLPEFPAAVLILVRVVGAGALLALVQVLRGVPFVRDRGDLLELALLGLLGITLNQSLFIFGLSHSTAINATILVTTVPVLTMVGAMLLGRERPTPRGLVGIAIAAAGTVWLIGPDRITLEPEVALGNALILTAMVAYSAYFLRAGRTLAKYDALTVTTHIMLLSIVTVLPVSLPALGSFDPRAVRPGIWAGVAFIVVGPTLFTYLLNAWALSKVSSSVVSVYIYLQPLMTAAVAPLLLRGEALTPRTVAAGLLVLGGVTLVLTAPRRLTVTPGSATLPDEASKAGPGVRA